jgi:hypothetical protein
MEIIYKASLDKVAKILTAIALIALIVAAIPIFFELPSYVGFFPGILVVTVIIIAYLYSVKSYKVTDEKLVIMRPISLFDKEISLSKIESVRVLGKDDYKWKVRTMGNGGFLGYTGYYANQKIGNFKMYATSRTNGILIILKEKQRKIVISPDDTAMVDDLQKHIKKQ